MTWGSYRGFSTISSTPSSQPLSPPITDFRWRGLATTNFDQIIEKAYWGQTDSAQEIAPIISNSDKFDDVLRSPDFVPLLKLHGCISRTRDDRTPLILTPDQYVTHKKSRDRLFKTLVEWGYENPVVAVGHRMQDPDIRQVLLELDSLGEFRPRYFLIAPDVSDEEVRFWEQQTRDSDSGNTRGFPQFAGHNVAASVSKNPR